MKILIVDDDAVSRHVLKEMCERLGYRVGEAANADDGWMAFARQSPRIVISDWLMPRVSGIDLCKWVRQSPSREGTFFFLVSGKKTGLDDFDAARRAGVDDFIYKPVDFSVLRGQLAEAERAILRRLPSLKLESFDDRRASAAGK